MGADDGAPGRIVADTWHAQARRRIDDREIAAELVETLVEQARHHRARAVQRIAGLASPETRLGAPPAPPLGRRHAERGLRGLQRGVESIGSPVATHLSHPLAEDGIELDPVAVAVDDWMVQARPDLRCRQVPVPAHVLSPPRSTGCAPRACWA